MKKQFRTKYKLYLRNQPSRLSDGLLVSAGTTLTCIDVVKGEMVDSIDDWYKTEKGLFFWSGGVEEITNNNSLFFWPLDISLKRITTPFSENWILNTKKKHTGIDIAAPAGQEVYAVSDCIVKEIGLLDTKGTMAKYVTVEHISGDFCSAYLHIDPIVKSGEKLKAKDIVGHTAKLIDMGTHLHFNLWKGLYNHLICRGALPSEEFAGKIEPLADPAFPGSFIDPLIQLN